MLQLILLTLLTNLLNPIDSVQVFKQFNPLPLLLNDTHHAYIQNLSLVKPSHDPHIVYKVPGQTPGTETLEDIIQAREGNEFMTFEEELSIGFWFRIPPDNPFNSQVKLMELDFSSEEPYIGVSVYDESLWSQSELQENVYNSLELLVAGGEWLFFAIDYMVSSGTLYIKVSINDIPKFTVKEEIIDKNKTFDFRNTIFSLGTTNFLRPSIYG